MGVPYFYSFIRRKRYTGVLRKNVPRYVSSFSLDANGIIHEQAQLVYAYGAGANPQRRKLVEKADPKILEAEFYNAISVKLQSILNQVRPTEIFVIAIDGVAPQAKIAQQRQRRFKSAIESGDIIAFDSNSITPGTDFMIRLDNFIQRWIVSYQSTLPPKVIYSSHMVPGEGEHKIMDLMRSGEITGEGAHVLYGMDADLIMLSMMAPLEHISLMREDVTDVIDIDSYKKVIQEELKTPTAIHDYVVMMFTIGNDFLPHTPTLEDMEEAIETLKRVYIETNQPLTADGDINWTGLTIYLEKLALEEPRLLHHEAIRDVKHPSRMLNAASVRTEKIEEGTVMTVGKKISFVTKVDYNTYRGAWYQNALGPKGDISPFRKLVPDHKFGVTMDEVVDMCKQYLTGIAWIYNYYTKGTIAINSDYVYRYHHTPLLFDVALVLKQLGKVDGYMAHANQVVLNPIHQLLSVLPIQSKKLLPREVTHLMNKDSPIADYYPVTAIIEMDGKNADWQGIALIPFVDPARVINAVNTTTVFSAERVKLYTQANNIVIIRDPEMAELDAQKRQFRQFLDREKEKMRGGRGRGRGYQGKDNQGNYNKERGRGRGGGKHGNTRDIDYQRKGGYQGKSQNKYQNKSPNKYQNRSPRRNNETGKYPKQQKDTPQIFQTQYPSTNMPPTNMPPTNIPQYSPINVPQYPAVTAPTGLVPEAPKATWTPKTTIL